MSGGRPRSALIKTKHLERSRVNKYNIQNMHETNAFLIIFELLTCKTSAKPQNCLDVSSEIQSTEVLRICLETLKILQSLRDNET